MSKFLQSYSSSIVPNMTQKCFWGDCREPLFKLCPVCGEKGYSWVIFCEKHFLLHQKIHELSLMPIHRSLIRRLFYCSRNKHRESVSGGLAAYMISCPDCGKEFGFRELQASTNGMVCNEGGISIEAWIKKQNLMKGE